MFSLYHRTSLLALASMGMGIGMEPPDYSTSRRRDTKDYSVAATNKRKKRKVKNKIAAASKRRNRK